jgi:cation:H+ antiporter
MIHDLIAVFLVSLGVLLWAGSFLVRALMEISRFLGWREFVIAFILVSLGSSLPNLSLGLASALHGIPELSFGDVVGGNIVNLTLVIALAALFAGSISTASQLVQKSALITVGIAVLPIILILDGVLGRADALLLLVIFLFYFRFLFSHRGKLEISVEDNKVSPLKNFRRFLANLGKIIIGLLLLIISAEGVVRSVSYVAGSFAVPLYLVGILVTGLGNSLPEIYFAIAAARKGDGWLVLGTAMGSAVFISTLVLGIVALVHPIKIPDISPFAIARLFLVLAALFFFFFIRTGKLLSRREAVFLILLYLAFVVWECLNQF